MFPKPPRVEYYGLTCTIFIPYGFRNIENKNPLNYQWMSDYFHLPRNWLKYLACIETHIYELGFECENIMEGQERIKIIQRKLKDQACFINPGICQFIDQYNIIEQEEDYCFKLAYYDGEHQFYQIKDSNIQNLITNIYYQADALERQGFTVAYPNLKRLVKTNLNTEESEKLNVQVTIL